jgi:hypothetical protein
MSLFPFDSPQINMHNGIAAQGNRQAKLYFEQLNTDKPSFAVLMRDIEAIHPDCNPIVCKPGNEPQIPGYARKSELQKEAAFETIPASAISIVANLDSRISQGSALRSWLQTYGPLATKLQVRMTFTKTGLTEWYCSATVPMKKAGSENPDFSIEVGIGSLQFDNCGKMIAPAHNPILSTAEFSGGSIDRAIEFRLWKDDGMPLITSHASESYITQVSRDMHSALPSRHADLKGARMHYPPHHFVNTRSQNYFVPGFLPNMCRYPVGF